MVSPCDRQAQGKITHHHFISHLTILNLKAKPWEPTRQTNGLPVNELERIQKDQKLIFLRYRQRVEFTSR